MSHALMLDGVSCHLDGQGVIDNLGFALAAGDIGCLVGPSGCGKSTVLRAIAGLQPLSGGRIVLGGNEVSRAGYTVEPRARGVGMVFQDWALFPHLSVRDNIAFGLHGQARQAIRDRVDHLLGMTGLQAIADRLPSRLSGGQQQRVALARAMAPAPRLLLLDEPFSSLDAGLRLHLADELQHWLHAEQVTALMVTHDQDEAFAMADRLGILMSGHLLQWDDPASVYLCPATPDVARFIGDGRFLAGVVAAGQVRTVLGAVSVANVNELPSGQAMDVFLRPEHLVSSGPHAGLRARVTRRRYRGGHTLCDVILPDGQSLLVTVAGQPPAVGDELAVGLRPDIAPVSGFVPGKR